MICTLCRQEKENVEIINKDIYEKILDFKIERTLIAIICEDCKDKRTTFEYLYGDNLENYITLRELRQQIPTSIMGTMSMLRAIYGDEEMDRYERKQKLEFEENQKYYGYLYNTVIGNTTK